ncbi:hypothetical protein INT80_14465 [Gallibacterium anatis]|uniref:Uncharacterized protein n=1 Tax=Gallibacterium anatis TaxID=750 RepID=A0A930USD3_9PAST|nr:hypothetical protein [Gallibacterium anatis]
MLPAIAASSDEAKFTVDATVPGDTNGNGKADDADDNKGKPTVTIPEATEATEADKHTLSMQKTLKTVFKFK